MRPGARWARFLCPRGQALRLCAYAGRSGHTLWAPDRPCLALVAGGTSAAQTCKYSSVPAIAPTSRCTDNGDGTVTDKATGLQWKSQIGLVA